MGKKGAAMNAKTLRALSVTGTIRAMLMMFALAVLSGCVAVPVAPGYYGGPPGYVAPAPMYYGAPAYYGPTVRFGIYGGSGGGYGRGYGHGYGRGFGHR
jgi:hypothetical protein